jgi:hypothetical protein
MHSRHSLQHPLSHQLYICSGEGVFFGLGTNIKFPACYEESPYSIIASGVTTLPQRVRFPFSLIMSPTESIKGLSIAINEIIPAWILYESEFTFFRNENKFISRGSGMYIHMLMYVYMYIYV